MKNIVRFDWTLKELQELYQQSLFKLLSKAHCIHKKYHNIAEIQVCKLISVKTGGCSEDCKYCAQSSRYQTGVEFEKLMDLETVVRIAKNAAEKGASRVCIGAGWRQVRTSKMFDEVLKMVKAITALGLEVCCTLGMLNEEQAKKLKKAGLYAYNHNLDTSPEFYKTIISTRSYDDRLKTLDEVKKAGLSVCCGGIVGLGESSLDRIKLLLQLCTRNPHPGSVPINRLIPIKGTPLGDQPILSSWKVLRVIALARILMPKSMIRLTAGRESMSSQEQALCFFAGANSIFSGDQLLTEKIFSFQDDQKLFELLGLNKKVAFS